MHVEIRKTGKKSKYYLAHSYREGAKFYKIRKYLGGDMSASKLNERKRIAEKLILEEIHRYRMISDPLSMELSKKEIDAVKKLEAQIPLKITHLSKKDWELFSEIFTYNTNAIEGSKLNLKEVKGLLEKDKWPEKSREDIAEALGVDEAISFLRTSREHISVPFIKKIHRIIFRNSKPFAGKLRKPGEEVAVIDSDGRIVHEGAPQQRIAHLLKELVEWYNANKKKYPALVLGAVVHNQFENIHPFRDGNGRVGRILLNNILIKNRLPPININFSNRMQYYAALKEYEANKDLKPTLNLFMKEYSDFQKKLGDHKRR